MHCLAKESKNVYRHTFRKKKSRLEATGPAQIKLSVMGINYTPYKVDQITNGHFCT